MVAILGAIVYQSFEATVFFHTPAEILAEPSSFEGKTIRIGALVVPESTHWDPEKVLLTFKVTEDNQSFIPIIYEGIKPDMYREGQGVVVEGRLDGEGVFQANTLLVKHSEEYSVDKSKIKDKEAAYRSLMK